MYTFEPPILYSEDSPAEDIPRSAPKMNKFKLFVPEGTMPLGLFLVAFPPPPVTFPATRLNDPKTFKRHSTHLADHFQGALPVFIRITPVCLAADLSKPFGFDFGRS